MERDIFDGLAKFGLSPYEIRVYSALLLKGRMNSTDIVRETEIPQPRVYDLFSSLIKKGFIEESLGKKKIYKAVPISEILKREQDWLTSYSFNLQKYVENRKLYPEKHSSFISLIEGEEQIIQKICQIIDAAEIEVIVSVSDEEFNKIAESIQKASERDVTIALLLFTKGNSNLSKIPKSVFFRRLEGKATKIIISDRKSCIVSVENFESKNNYALYFEEDNFIHVMSYYFDESFWSVAEKPKTFPEKNKYTLSNIWLACEVIDFLIGSGKQIKAVVDGYHFDDRRTIKGYVTGTDRIPFVRNTFYIQENSKSYSVGGKTATIEDIKMLSVTLYPELL
ncbi:MAG: TrmB family transcriptional regulator [Thermoplasmatales archaeon]